MTLDVVEIEKVLLQTDVMVEIHSFTEDVVPFNGSTLQIVSQPDIYKAPDKAYMGSLVQSMRKSGFKDKVAMKEFTTLLAQTRSAKPEQKDFKALQATRRGVVARLPKRSNEFGSYDFRCPLDLKEGDECWFDSYETRMQMNRGKTDTDKLIESGDRKFLILPSQSIHCRKRDNILTPVNGNIIGRKLPNDSFYGSVIMPGVGVAKIEVTAVPNYYPEYAFFNDWHNTEVKAGDIVFIMDYFAIALDPTMADSAEGLVRFQPRVILAVI